MTDRLHLLPRHRRLLEALLHKHLPEVEVWAYGSRVNGRSHDGSDLDLVLRGPGLNKIPIDSLVDFEEAVRESTIPFLVEARDWARLPERFHHEIERDHVVLNEILYTGGKWSDMSFTEAVQVNPAVRIERGKTYPYVDMATVNASSRCVYALTKRKYSGGGSRFCCGDTLMARITPCLENGKIARYCSMDELETAHGSTEFIVIRGRPGITDTNFAYYLTQWEEVRSYSVGQMTGTSGRQRVPTESLRHLQVPIPPLLEQRAIAHILGTLDDKIELNRRMNETLEAVARALFKSWFIDFDPVRARMEGRDTGLPKHIADLFPDRLVGSELGEIPEGWDVETIGDIATIAGGTTPSTKEPKYWEGGIHCWVTPKDLSDLRVPVLLDTERKISDAGLEQIGSGLLPKGTVLLSSRAPIGYLAIAEISVAINQGFIAILPFESISNLFLLYWCKASQNEIVAHANGSTFLEISKSNFRRISLAMPCTSIMDAFDGLARPLYETIVSNVKESRTLTALRDVLLPKLLSGEIRLDEAERAAEAMT